MIHVGRMKTFGSEDEWLLLNKAAVFRIRLGGDARVHPSLERNTPRILSNVAVAIVLVRFVIERRGVTIGFVSHDRSVESIAGGWCHQGVGLAQLLQAQQGHPFIRR